jgi:hypothetical protein
MLRIVEPYIPWGVPEPEVSKWTNLQALLWQNQ